MTDNLDELEAIAGAATPGPWHVNNTKSPDIEWEKGPICHMRWVDGIQPNLMNEDAVFIAAANPQTVKSLITAARERDALKAENAKLREALQKSKASMNIMANKACEVGLEGTSDWDKIAGTADLFGCINMVSAALEGEGK